MSQNEVDRSVAPTEPRLAAAWAVRALQCSLVQRLRGNLPAPPLHRPGGPRIPALWLWVRCLGHRGNAVGSGHKATPLHTAFPEQLLTPTPLSTLPPPQSTVFPLPFLPAPNHSPLGRRSPRLRPPTPLPPQHCEPARTTYPSCLGISWFKYHQSGISCKEGKHSFACMIKL